MPTFQTYQAIGNREDLTDTLVNISHDETPLYSGLDKVKAKGTLHEWQTDSLASPGVNAAVEGADFNAGTVTPTVRLTNYTQINRKDIKISGTQQAVEHAGRDNEYNYQKAKQMKELARDIEYSLINGTANAGNATTARTLKGMLAWITTNVATSGAARALTEALYNAQVQAVWAGTNSKPDTTFVHGFNKRAISGFTGGTGSTRQTQADEKKLVNTVDTYVSDFGTQVIVAHDLFPTDQAVITRKDKWRVAVLRPPHEEDIGQVGDSLVTMLVSELTLESLNEKASAKIANLTSS